MTLPRRHPWTWLRPVSSAPAPEPVEQTSVGVVLARPIPTTVSGRFPTDCRPVSYGDEDHCGSADLEEWVPSFAEMYWSDQATLTVPTPGAAEQLRLIAQSDVRAAALKQDARVRRASDLLLERLS